METWHDTGLRHRSQSLEQPQRRQAVVCHKMTLLTFSFVNCHCDLNLCAVIELFWRVVRPWTWCATVDVCDLGCVHDLVHAGWRRMCATLDMLCDHWICELGKVCPWRFVWPWTCFSCEWRLYGTHTHHTEICIRYVGPTLRANGSSNHIFNLCHSQTYMVKYSIDFCMDLFSTKSCLGLNFHGYPRAVAMLSLHIIVIIIIYPSNVRVVGAPWMISQPVFSILPCSSLPSGTCQTPGLSIPWCCPPATPSACPALFPLSLCLCEMVLAGPDEWETWPYHCSLRLYTIVRRSLHGPIACWILARTKLAQIPQSCSYALSFAQSHYQPFYQRYVFSMLFLLHH